MSTNTTEHEATDRPRVSVIMAVRGPAPWLQEALRSVTKQTTESWELRVGVDGHDPEVIRTLEEFGTTVHWEILPSGSGAGACRNAALWAARGRYIAVLDSDDVWSANHLRHHLESFEKNPELVLLGGRGVNINEQGVPASRPRKHATHFLKQQLPLRNVFVHSSVMYRAHAARRVGGYDPSVPIGEDFKLWMALAGEGEIGNCRSIHVFYRNHPAQLSQAPLRLQGAEAIRGARIELASQVGVPIALALVAHKLWMM